MNNFVVGNVIHLPVTRCFNSSVVSPTVLDATVSVVA